MCRHNDNTTRQPDQQPSAEMLNPYYNYIQMLLPLMAGKAAADNSESSDSSDHEAELPDEVTIAIFSDNARAPPKRESMTMRSKLKLQASKAGATKRCRWSSVPDIAEISELLAAKTPTTKGRRSSDDLKSLMLNNSRIPRSTDNLRSCQSTGSLKRSNEREPQETSQKQNDRWDLPKASGRSTPIKSNPFDLRMPSYNVAPAPPPARLLSRPVEKLSPKTLVLKKPQRQSSAESQREADTKLALQKLLQNLKTTVAAKTTPEVFVGGDSDKDVKNKERPTSRDMPPMTVQRAA